MKFPGGKKNNKKKAKNVIILTFYYWYVTSELSNKNDVANIHFSGHKSCLFLLHSIRQWPKSWTPHNAGK